MRALINLEDTAIEYHNVDFAGRPDEVYIGNFRFKRCINIRGHKVMYATGPSRMKMIGGVWEECRNLNYVMGSTVTLKTVFRLAWQFFWALMRCRIRRRG